MQKQLSEKKKSCSAYGYEGLQQIPLNPRIHHKVLSGLHKHLQTAYYAVIRKDEPENSNTRKLLEAMKSKRGQNVAKEAGYVQNY